MAVYNSSTGRPRFCIEPGQPPSANRQSSVFGLLGGQQAVVSALF